ncbi:MAG TPA: putative Fe-S cluster assembly protein SufT [Opitutales bacterium]|nr:putative Fe-S cluster assembly protein SufT [Opitutales bacterium]HOO94023.1 putative Fe-S cluster assembly protein SufT [Opitutales bacterium]
MNDERILSREVSATLIPHGEPFTLDEGTPVVITHRLGGNFTVMTDNGMFRISREDADALGETPEAAPSGASATASDHTPSMEELWDALKRVYDPEIPVNIVDLGLVYSIDLQSKESGGHHVEMAMTLTAPGCGMGPVIADDAKNRLLGVEGVSSANVEIVWDPPWHQDMISEEGKMELGLI